MTLCSARMVWQRYRRASDLGKLPTITLWLSEDGLDEQQQLVTVLKDLV